LYIPATSMKQVNDNGFKISTFYNIVFHEKINVFCLEQ
jgi:hypothetical protein